jgi:large subunit ribosomal protein L2
MPVRNYNPTTPGRRGMSSQDFDAITTKKPLKSLTVIKKGAVGRNNQGRITTRHRGRGVRHYSNY